MDNFVIMAIPDASDEIWRISSENPPHATLVYLPESARGLAEEAMLSIFRDPFTAYVGERGTLGENEADVLHLKSQDLVGLREELLSYPGMREAHDSIEQWPDYTPHLTLGYKETPPLQEADVKEIRFTGIAISPKEGSDVMFGSELKSEPGFSEYEEYTVDPLPFHGVLAAEGRERTGDDRGILFTPNSMIWPPPPFALRWQERDAPGHDDAVTVGTITHISRVENGDIRFQGYFAFTEDSDRLTELMATGAVWGVSVDLDSAVGDVDEETGDRDISHGRIRSACVSPLQAFIGAWIEIGEWPDGDV